MPSTTAPHERLPLLFCVLLCACAGGSNQAVQAGVNGGAGTDGGSFGAAGGGMAGGCAPTCDDFPATPIFDDSSGDAPPADAAKYFSAPEKLDGPGACVIEPALSEGDRPGVLLPRNWLRPRFRFTPLPGEDLWQITLAANIEKQPLVAYTKHTTWTLPREIWKALGHHESDVSITVTIRGVSTGAPGKVSGTRGSFAIAPVEARGKLVYWATTSSEVKPDTSKLVGFAVGDESVIDALTISQVGDRGTLNAGGRDLRGMYDDGKGVPAGHAQCIGCHVSTPDGEAVAFTDHWPWNNLLASVQGASAGARPAYMTAGAELLLNQPWLGMQAFSAAHWRDGDRVVLGVYSPRNAANGGGVGFADGAPYPSHDDGLAWFDLETKVTFERDSTQGDVQQQLNQQIAAAEGTAFGRLVLDGETRSVAAPSFSHDGTRIVYTSADATQDGRLSGNNGEVDLHIVPYADRKGGSVMPLRGAAEPGVAEYYPAFSADDALVAFTRVAELDDAPIYYRPDGEVFVIPSSGGKATRVLGNDPPACTGERSPGVINSWPKWSPVISRVGSVNDEFAHGPRTFYWLVFSSARAYEGSFELPKTQYSPPDTRSSQLYMSAVVLHDDTGELETFPAVYLWNQDPSTSNLTPAWEEFKIPEVPGPE